MKLHCFFPLNAPLFNTKTFAFSTIFTLFFASLFTACSYTEKLTDGKTAYERKYYAEAVRLLQREFGSTKVAAEKAEKAFLLAESYSHFGKTAEVEKWLQTAIDNNYGEAAQLAMANLLKREGKYNEAAKAFDLLGKELGDNTKYRREVSACRIAATWAADTKTGIVIDKVAAINSSANDFSPAQDKDGNLVFASDRKRPDVVDPKHGEPIYGWTGRVFSDFYAQNKTDGLLPFDEINSEFNEGSLCFNADFTELYFTTCGSNKREGTDFCRIMHSKFTGDHWAKIEEVKMNTEGYNVQHPCLSSDGKRLYFSSNLPEGSGGYDIFYIDKKPDGEWSEWHNAGITINTPNNELFPVFDADTLYFSSDGHTGMGGLDVFSTFQIRGKWQPPLNLKAPINSGEDDFGFIIDKKFDAIKNTEKEKNAPQKLLKRGYFTSSRGGNDDIYSFEKRTLPKPVVPVTPINTTPKDPPVNIVYKEILEVNIVKKKFSIPNNPNSKVIGFEPIPLAALQIEGMDSSYTGVVNDKGQFIFTIKENNAYGFLASKTGFFSKKASFNTGLVEKNPKNPITVHKLTIVLEQIFENQEIVLDNIYYDYDKADIRADAQPTLNELAEVLRRNPTISIQLSSHTDCRGRDAYNLNLSQLRAQAAVNYLIAHGIVATRLSAKGYGETSPAAACDCAKCTETEHQINRRTTFKVLKSTE